MTTLGGAVAIAVNEADNLLYAAGVNGTVSVFALDAPVAPAAFSVNGVIRNAQGTPVAGVTVSASGARGTATAVTDATGLFVLAGLPIDTYTVMPASASFTFAPASETVSVFDRNVGSLELPANSATAPAGRTGGRGR